MTRKLMTRWWSPDLNGPGYGRSVEVKSCQAFPGNGFNTGRGYALHLSTVTVDKTSPNGCQCDALTEGIAVPSCTDPES